MLSLADPLQVWDEVLADVAAYRAAAHRLPYGDLTDADGVVFHGLAADPDGALPAWIRARHPGLQPTLSFFRRSPAGQVEPHYLHHDATMGDWTALLYLTADPAPGDGTTFWRHRATGVSAWAPGAALDATDLAAWDPWQTVPAVCNRLVLFPAPWYHARALPENYGAGDTARLVQVVFGTGALD